MRNASGKKLSSREDGSRYVAARRPEPSGDKRRLSALSGRTHAAHERPFTDTLRTPANLKHGHRTAPGLPKTGCNIPAMLFSYMRMHTSEYC